MTANFKNGMRPSTADQARCIPMLLETAPDFGYDSKLVNKWVASFGVPESTARNHTSPDIAAIKAKRDAKIMELLGEGKSQRTIAEEVGCSQPKIAEFVKALSDQKSPVDKNDHAESPNATPSIQGCQADQSTNSTKKSAGQNDAKCPADKTHQESPNETSSIQGRRT